MIPFPLKKYRYKLYFSTHLWEFTNDVTPDNMQQDFDSGEIIRYDFNSAIFFVDFSKVLMIKCEEDIDFKDLPKEQNE